LTKPDWISNCKNDVNKEWQHVHRRATGQSLQTSAQQQKINLNWKEQAPSLNLTPAKKTIVKQGGRDHHFTKDE